MNIRKSRKGLMLNWFNYAFAFVVGTVFFFIIYSIITSGTVRVEREIVAQTLDMKSEEILIGFLSGYVTKDSDAGLEGDAYKTAKELADSGTTVAGLIGMINDDDEAVHREILEKETRYVLDKAIGGQRWKLDITFPEGSTITYGEVQGEARVYDTALPSTGYNTIKVRLTVSSGQYES